MSLGEKNNVSNSRKSAYGNFGINVEKLQASCLTDLPYPSLNQCKEYHPNPPRGNALLTPPPH